MNEQQIEQHIKLASGRSGSIPEGRPSCGALALRAGKRPVGQGVRFLNIIVGAEVPIVMSAVAGNFGRYGSLGRDGALCHLQALANALLEAKTPTEHTVCPTLLVIGIFRDRYR